MDCCYQLRGPAGRGWVMAVALLLLTAACTPGTDREARVEELELALEDTEERAEAAETRAERAEARAAQLAEDLAAIEEGAESEREQVGEDEPASVGGLRYLVTGHECYNGFRFEDDFTGEVDEVMAQGQFCVIELQVENVGDEPLHVDASRFFAVDPEGRHYGMDEITYDINSVEESAFYDDLNPGQAGDLSVAFDLVRETIAAELEIRDTEEGAFQETEVRIELPEPVWGGEGEPDWDL